MNLKELRKLRKLTQKELAAMSGVNFRSLQDYEQGRKKLSSASGDVLLRLSTVLGCSMETLLADASFSGAPLLPSNQITTDEIQSQHFYCEKYKTAGRWICSGSTVSILFYYEGERYTIPFKAIFDRENLSWLKEAAVMCMDSKIRELLFSRLEMEAW